MTERIDIVVVGAGQAGLSLSHELGAHGVEHVVLERGTIGQTWRGRWDSFCLVTPNWSIELPGGAYDGDDPDGFMPRDAIAAHLADYAASFAAPVREGVDVTAIERSGDGFRVRTSDGELSARVVALASGAYQRSHRPAAIAGLPRSIPVVDAAEYRNEAELPSGRVLVVGSGQTGCQLAEEFHEAGREVILACGRAPWSPRRIDGRDVVWWGVESGFLAQRVETLPDPSFRLTSNILATGHGGGHDLHLRTLDAMEGVTLAGHLAEAGGQVVRFADDLAASLAWGDERTRAFFDLVHATAAERGLPDPETPPMPPLVGTPPTSIDVAGLAAVVVTSGFRPDYRSWLPWPEAFDDLGFPVHHDGMSTVVPGLAFVGVHFLRTRESSILHGVGRDATLVAAGIAEHLGAR